MERATRKPRLTKAQVRDFVFWLFEKNEELRKNATSGLIKQMYLKEMNMDVSQPFVKQNRDAWIAHLLQHRFIRCYFKQDD